MLEGIPTQTEQRNRRAEDSIPHLQILMDIRSEVQSIRQELVEFKKDVNKAFPKDQDGLPDYAGHRKGHERDDKAAEKREEFQIGFASHIVRWAGVGFLGFVVGLIVTYFKGGGTA